MLSTCGGGGGGGVHHGQRRSERCAQAVQEGGHDSLQHPGLQVSSATHDGLGESRLRCTIYEPANGIVP